MLNVHDASATELKMIFIKTVEYLNHVLIAETMLKIIDLNTKCVYIMLKNIFAGNAVVLKYVNIIYKDVFAGIVVVLRFVSIN